MAIDFLHYKANIPVMNWKSKLTLLLDAGLTQSEIAMRIGVTQGAVSQVLRDDTGRRGFGYETGKKLDALCRKYRKTKGQPSLAA